MSGAVSGNAALQVVESITQFVNGTQAVWNTITLPVPDGMVVYATDTTVVKMGDGTTLYTNLPTLFTLSDITELATNVSTLQSDVSGIQSNDTTYATEIAAVQASITTIQNQITSLTATQIVTDSSVVSVSSTEYFIGIANTTPVATTVTLPATPLTNEVHVVKDVNGVSQLYNITIQGNGNLIDGQDDIVMTTNYQSLTLFWNGTSWSLI